MSRYCPASSSSSLAPHTTPTTSRGGGSDCTVGVSDGGSGVGDGGGAGFHCESQYTAEDNGNTWNTYC